MKKPKQSCIKIQRCVSEVSDVSSDEGMSEVNSSKEDSDVIGYNNELLPGMVFIVIGGISTTITLREEGEHPSIPYNNKCRE